jgi:hypothetical protein
VGLFIAPTRDDQHFSVLYLLRKLNHTGQQNPCLVSQILASFSMDAATAFVQKLFKKRLI